MIMIIICMIVLNFLPSSDVYQNFLHTTYHLHITYYITYKTKYKKKRIYTLFVIRMDHLGQIFVLLIFRAISVNLIKTEIRMCDVTQSDRSRRSANLLHNDKMIEICTVSTTILRFCRNTQ